MSIRDLHSFCLPVYRHAKRQPSQRFIIPKILLFAERNKIGMIRAQATLQKRYPLTKQMHPNNITISGGGGDMDVYLVCITPIHLYTTQNQLSGGRHS